MTKFGELEDIGFKRISAQLRRWNDDMKAISGTAFDRTAFKDP